METFDVGIVCDRGFEAECANHTTELTGCTTATYPTYIVAKNQTASDALHLIHNQQLAIKLFAHLGTVDSFDAALAQMKTTSLLPDWMDDSSTFRVSVKSDMVDDPNAAAGDVGAVILERFPNAKVNLKEPLVHFYVYEQDSKFHLGIDLTQTSLYKREYKVFQTPATLKATIAFGLIKFSGFKPGMTLLDPFCGSGAIPIEASLYALPRSALHYKRDQIACLSLAPFRGIDAAALFEKWDKPNKKQSIIIGYDIQTKNVDFSKKNAKIAGIVKDITLARVEVDWLDLKVADGEIDCIVCAPPLFANHIDEKKTLKSFERLFHRGASLLTKNGKMALLTNSAYKIKEIIPSTLKLQSEKIVYQGQQAFSVLLIGKK